MEYFPTTNTCSYDMASTVETSKKKPKDKEKKMKSKGVKLSTDPQSIAARERRHRISDRFKILQSMVPGGTKMDTVSMLEEAIHYVKFLKTHIWLHQSIINSSSSPSCLIPTHDPDCLFYPHGNLVNSVESLQLPPLPSTDSCFLGEETSFSYDGYVKF